MPRSLLHHVGLGRRVEPLGRVLVRSGLITEGQLRQALETQRRTGRQLGRIVVDRGFASEFDVLQAIARHYRISAASLTDDFGALLRRPASLRERIATMRVPIRVKLSIAITFMVLVTILTLSFENYARQKERLRAQATETAKFMLRIFKSNTAVPLLEDDTLRLNSLIRDPDPPSWLMYASVVDRTGKVRAHTNTALVGTFVPAPGESDADDVAARELHTAKGHILNLSIPISFAQKHLGEANIGISLDVIDTRIFDETMKILRLSLLIVGFGILIAIVIGVGFSRPISRLVLATQEIGTGNFQVRVERVRGDELGDLAAAFNYMARELWRKLVMQRSFGSYVSPEVLEMVLAHPEGNWLRGNRRDVTVLFADVRGFAPFAEANEPERVVEAVNEYFGIASRHILAEGGYVDKFIGDAVLGVFGVPVAQPDHAQRAVRAAVAMQRELIANAGERNPLLDRVGIGINSGVAVAGDLGSELKRQYSVIGDCVNLASRLSSLAAGGRIILSRSTREAAAALVAATSLPPVTVKGKSEPVEIFEVVGLAGETEGAPGGAGG